ncbi:hypothetical protein HPB50_022185 [Hyalomma asiaticum]|uniref:Uncharacterized protein n=1 Tax=Hyalomma asiaticum TaxID=266040 RepID=A0ACB7S2W3_HYAAI|nr:hypothetical protein HPB50_022185 [Hyalomma asiaticum]
MGKQLKGSSYSLVVDESTDISTTKQLCIVVRFLNSAKNKNATTLLDLVELSDGTAQTLHDTVMKTLDKHGLPVKNSLGLCTDGANSMSGNHNSLFSRLREDNKELVLVKCACHSLDLVASKSMEAIPSADEHLLLCAIVCGRVHGLGHRVDDVFCSRDVLLSDVVWSVPVPAD